MPQFSEHILIRKSSERGHVSHGWLDSHFSFSFNGYHDPRHMGFRTLRVINEDNISPGEGFATHPHKDIEIISYVIAGELAHKDSLGNESVIRAGNLQRMSAGTGVSHSEFNPSKTETTHLLQIWILPEKRGLKPSYQDIDLTGQKLTDALTLIAAPAETKAPLIIHQDADLYLGRFSKSTAVDYRLRDGRGIWIQVVKGPVELLDTELSNGDGCAITNCSVIPITAKEGSEFLLFDLK